MSALYLTPIALSLLLLGAHLYRHGGAWPSLAVLVLAGLLFVPRPWAARVVQFALLLAAAEWLRTLLVLVLARLQTGESYARLAAILGVVSIVTGASALLFQTRRLRAVYGFGPVGDETSARVASARLAPSDPAEQPREEKSV
jgi:hypothetical protein